VVESCASVIRCWTTTNSHPRAILRSMAQLEERLAANEIEGVRAFLAALLADREIDIDSVWLTGSKAKGEGAEEADVGMLVVVGTGAVGVQRIGALAAEHAFASGVRLDVHVLDRDEWARQALKGSDLYRTIQANGVPLLDEGGTS